MSNKVKVVICGKDFTLQTSESANYVFGLARTLESRISEITDSNSSEVPQGVPPESRPALKFPACSFGRFQRSFPQLLFQCGNPGA